MHRKLLLPALAATLLAGCATDYAYRGGNGDYYYGQPRTEYRYYDPQGYGLYGSYGYGNYAPAYYYDRLGRLVYRNPYGYYGSYGSPYGSPYGSGGWWYRPRPQHGGHGDHHDDHAGDGNREERRPPWRNLGGVLPPDGRATGEGDEGSRPVRRQQSPYSRAMPVPQRGEQREFAPPAPRMRSDDGGGSRMGRAIRGAKSSPPADE